MRYDWKYWQLEYELLPCARQTYHWRAMVLERMQKHFGAERDIRYIFKQDVEHYKNSRYDHVNAMTVKTEINVGKSFYYYLARKGVVEPWFNPFKDVRVAIQKKEKPPES